MTNSLDDEVLDETANAYVEELTKEIQTNPPWACPVSFNWSGNDELAHQVTVLLQIHAVLMRRQHPWLNFSALDSIVFHHDYPQALRDLSERAGREFHATTETSGVGLAMVVHMDDRCVTVLDAGIALGIAQSEDQSQRRLCIDLVMHELCHVHDYGRKSALLTHEFLKRKMEGLEGCSFAAAESAWNEYFANYYCTSNISNPDLYPKYLAEVIPDVVEEVKSAIRDYRLHHRLEDVVALSQQKVRFIFQCFGYAAGRLAANRVTLGDVAPESVEALKAAGLSNVWRAVVVELQRLDSCRDAWTSFDELKSLMDLVLQTYGALGMHYSVKASSVWVDIPYSSDTMPQRRCLDG
jgi:hypothetical protein